MPSSRSTPAARPRAPQSSPRSTTPQQRCPVLPRDSATHSPRPSKPGLPLRMIVWPTSCTWPTISRANAPPANAPTSCAGWLSPRPKRSGSRTHAVQRTERKATHQINRDRRYDVNPRPRNRTVCGQCSRGQRIRIQHLIRHHERYPNRQTPDDVARRGDWNPLSGRAMHSDLDRVQARVVQRPRRMKT